MGLFSKIFKSKKEETFQQPIETSSENYDYALISQTISEISKTMPELPVCEEEIEFTMEKPSSEEETLLYDPTKELFYYKKPTLDLFGVQAPCPEDKEHIESLRNIIEQIIATYKIKAESIEVTESNIVDYVEIKVPIGSKISKLKNAEDDFAMALLAKSVRLQIPILGSGNIGIEISKKEPTSFSLASILNTEDFSNSEHKLPCFIGKKPNGETFSFDLTELPHLLISGQSGQGKSTCIHNIINSLLFKKHPAEVKFVIIDPNILEYNHYSPIEKHFMAKIPDAKSAIVMDINTAVETLKSLCIEMDDRYMLLKEANVRQVKEYNEKFINRKLNPAKGHHFMPYIVVIIDGFDDLIMQTGKEVGQPIARIAQKARAVGIHMILTTQSSSANIITDAIRVNVPARITFHMSNEHESRAIISQSGAEKLYVPGDALVKLDAVQRVQCAYMDTHEIEKIAQFISRQQGYQDAYSLPDPPSEGENDGPKDVDLTKLDPRFEEAAALIVSTQQGSTSLIQRKLSLGYNRAGHLMDQLEVAGIVGPQSGSAPREVIIKDLDQLDMIISRLKNL